MDKNLILNHFMKDVRKINRTPKAVDHRRKYRDKNIPAHITRLYNDDTNEFEPIPENREHFLHILMPLVISMANTARQKYTHRIEYQDVIQAGMIGAIDAIDRYIEDTKTRVHTAKLSTFAYGYIRKYINEYCHDHNTLLSSERTKWAVASNSFVNSGDDTVGDAEGSKTLFDWAPAKSLQQVQPDSEEAIKIDSLSKQLLESLTTDEHNMLFMQYGIGVNQPMTLSEIAKEYNRSTCYVHRRVTAAIAKLRNNAASQSHLIALLDISSCKSLETSKQWKLVRS